MSLRGSCTDQALCQALLRRALEAKAQPEISDVVARVGAAADETVLVHIADFTGETLRQRSGNRHEIAHPVDARPPLKARLVHVHERLVAEVQRELALDGHRIFDVWTKTPARAVPAVAPALLQPEAAAELARAELCEIIECDLL